MAEMWFQDLSNRNLLGIPDHGAVTMGWNLKGSDMMQLAWNGRGGKRYEIQSSTNLLAAPPLWSTFNGFSNMMAMPPGTNISFALLVDQERYFRIETSNLIWNESD